MPSPADLDLYAAAAAGNLSGVEAAFAAGADIAAVSNSGETALHAAAFSGNLEVVKAFLRRGAKLSKELLAGVQARIESIRNNAEKGMVDYEAVEAWKAFAGGLYTAAVRQELPELVKGLTAASPEERYGAIQRVSGCVAALNLLVSDENPEIRAMAQHALKMASGVRKR